MGAVETITCPRCGETKPATSDYFHKNPKTSHGFQTVCKPCRIKYEHDRYMSKRDEICRQAREHRAANAASIRQKDRERYAERKRIDPDAVRAQNRAQYLRHRHARLAAMAAYRRENSDQVKAYFDARYKRFIDNLSILKQATGCAVCGRRDGKLDYHHIDKATKKHNIAGMHNCSLEAFIDEVGKCIVLCGSCHARHHRMEQLGRPSEVAS